MVRLARRPEPLVSQVRPFRPRARRAGPPVRNPGGVHRAVPEAEQQHVREDEQRARQVDGVRLFVVERARFVGRFVDVFQSARAAARRPRAVVGHHVPDQDEHQHRADALAHVVEHGLERQARDVPRGGPLHGVDGQEQHRAEPDAVRQVARLDCVRAESERRDGVHGLDGVHDVERVRPAYVQREEQPAQQVAFLPPVVPQERRWRVRLRRQRHAAELVIVAVPVQAVQVKLLILRVRRVIQELHLRPTQRQSDLLVRPLRTRPLEQQNGHVHAGAVERERPEPVDVARDVEPLGAKRHGHLELELAVRDALLVEPAGVEPRDLLVLLRRTEPESRARDEPRAPYGLGWVLAFGFRGEPDQARIGPVQQDEPSQMERLLSLLGDHLPRLQAHHRLHHRGRVRPVERAFVPRERRVVPRGAHRGVQGETEDEDECDRDGVRGADSWQKIQIRGES